MNILGIRTDKPQAELWLQIGDDIQKVEWEGHKQLSSTIFYKLDELFDAANSKFDQIEGIVAFEGPGSFTGLRIGVTLANTLSYSLDVPVVAAAGDIWFAQGIEKLKSGENQKVVLPVYGGEANITKPRK
ncbi:TPA: tRNA (adenosine(37)-N6)-threonylcarbamoyltransferase complex dimerization subunit type 1 TsaB [Candidatus Saccharibacteria bacterium]|nr:tRNA (adenosine(37)-N6)-threonylcarbamoyltransferase complex dimerization subunit type 1 TsaB [Candidatus Saccharibacteria bacterium]HIO87989.1 tRNA (adenosine(37)-N6)-threonylcarbamoyltransferase complex dimerization subunit type 1 TsaB [Candidatus Saccharibacteria bacterium]